MDVPEHPTSMPGNGPRSSMTRAPRSTVNSLVAS
jgi:hypothetical protein